MENKKIALGADHAGFAYKEKVKEVLIVKGHEVLDMGTNSGDSVDYPDFIHPVAESIEKGEADSGIVFCGTGNGVAMTANKHQGIRAGIAWNTELAELIRQHNDANILAIPARFVSMDLAVQMANRFLTTEFEGGRHARRVGKIACS